MWKFADQIGVSEKLAAEGFLQKAGGIIVWDGKIRAMRFANFGFTRPALHVERDRFDDILLKHAESLGARVFERVGVVGVEHVGQGENVVRYNDRRDGAPADGTIRCRFVVDASGNAAVIAGGAGTRRRVGTDGKYLGVWGYFRNSKYLGPDRSIHRAEELGRVPPVTFVSSFQDGWLWHIPLRQTTSVGLVLNTAATRGQGRREQERYFLETCRTLPYLGELLADAEYVEDSVAFRPDYSYYSERITGPGFVSAGDAAAFVDPIFSQGVVFAMYSGGLAAWTARWSLASPSREGFYRDVFSERSKQFYGFSRLLAFGDFGGEGVDPAAVRELVISMPRAEMELSLTASAMVGRSANLHRMLTEAGFEADGMIQYLENRSETLAGIHQPVTAPG
jgi:flavin-dependent dehydrogenase